MERRAFLGLASGALAGCGAPMAVKKENNKTLVIDVPSHVDVTPGETEQVAVTLWNVESFQISGPNYRYWETKHVQNRCGASSNTKIIVGTRPSSFSQHPDSVAKSCPPQYRWDEPRDRVDVEVTVEATENATAGDYKMSLFAIGTSERAFPVPSHSVAVTVSVTA